MLKVKNLDVYYGEAQAIWGLNLRVESGTICTLVGANGGGKTTFMKTLCGLLSVPMGSIFFDGEDLLAVTAEDRVSMGLSMCPEGRKIFANMTVEEMRKGFHQLVARLYSKSFTNWRRTAFKRRLKDALRHKKEAS